MFLTLVLKMSPEEYAKSSVILAYVKVTFNYVALLLLGIGLLGLSKRFKATLVENA